MTGKMGLNSCHQAIACLGENLVGLNDIERRLLSGIKIGVGIDIFKRVMNNNSDVDAEDKDVEEVLKKHGTFFPYFILSGNPEIPYQIIVLMSGNDFKLRRKSEQREEVEAKKKTGKDGNISTENSLFRMHGSSSAPNPNDKYLVVIFERPTDSDLETWKGPQEITNLGCIGSVIVENVLKEGILVKKGNERIVYASCC